MESEDASDSLSDNLEVSLTVGDLKLLLGRLGDLEDPCFKSLEVIREIRLRVVCGQNLNPPKYMFRRILMSRVIKRRTTAVR